VDPRQGFFGVVFDVAYTTIMKYGIAQMKSGFCFWWIFGIPTFALVEKQEMVQVFQNARQQGLWNL
jgi:hypothetical protein